MTHVPMKVPQKRASRQLLTIIVGIGLGLAAVAAVTYAVLPRPAKFDSPVIGGSFTMIGQNGQVVTNADLAGRPYLVFLAIRTVQTFARQRSSIFRRC
jgi:cytochrome oxidase Cu insertion factor (SCO1/SenC/PrrC family)